MPGEPRPPAGRGVYCDRADPRLLVRVPATFRGWTFNLGHPLAWAMVAAIVVLPLVGLAFVLLR